MKKTKGIYESEISKAITQWEKIFRKRFFVCKTDILRDMVIVSLQGILTPAEYRVCKTNEGLLNIKRTRSELVESGEEDLSRIIKDLTGLNVKSFHSDLSTITGERVMILSWKIVLIKHYMSNKLFNGTIFNR